jgi:hypothetical protein
MQVSKAQSPAATLTLGIVLPEPSDELSQDQVQKLESKIIQIINNSNEVTVGYTNDIVVYPIISVNETGVVEGGLQNITVTTLDFALFVKQISTNLVYNSFSKKIKGSGNNKAQAISNAFSQINTNDAAYKQFIIASKEKILKYYAENCQAIIRNADNLSAKQQYEQSISLLQSIPNASACYNDAQKKSLEVYKKYQTILCSQNITKAKAAIAINNYKEAMAALGVIDPASSCYPEVKNLIAQVSSKIERKEQRAADLEEQRINATREKQQLAADLETQRINAAREIAKAYYANSVRVVKYNVFIRRR